MQRNLEFPSYYVTGRSSPVNPQRHLSVNPIISVLPQPRGSPKPPHKALHCDTRLHLRCAAWVGQLNKEIHCNCSIWQPTVRPHTEHRNVFLQLWQQQMDKITRASKKRTKVSFEVAVPLSGCCCSQSSGCLSFTALSSPSLPKLCHEICIHIQYIGNQSQHTELKAWPASFVSHRSKTSFVL